MLDYRRKPCSKRSTPVIGTNAASSRAVVKEEMRQQAACQLACFLMSRANSVCDVVDMLVVKNCEPAPGRGAVVNARGGEIQVFGVQTGDELAGSVLRGIHTEMFDDN